MQNKYFMQEKIVIGENRIVISVEVNTTRESKRTALDELKQAFTEMQERLFPMPAESVRIVCRKVGEPVNGLDYEWRLSEITGRAIGGTAPTLTYIERVTKERFPGKQITLIVQNTKRENREDISHDGKGGDGGDDESAGGKRETHAENVS